MKMKGTKFKLFSFLIILILMLNGCINSSSNIDSKNTTLINKAIIILAIMVEVAAIEVRECLFFH